MTDLPCKCPKRPDGTRVVVSAYCPAHTVRGREAYEREQAILVLDMSKHVEADEVEPLPPIRWEDIPEAVAEMGRRFRLTMDDGDASNARVQALNDDHAEFDRSFEGQTDVEEDSERTLRPLEEHAPEEIPVVVLKQGGHFGPVQGKMERMVGPARFTGSIGAPIKPVRLTWDDWALDLCEAVAKRADCRRRQVGAVILDGEHRVVATGYNGYPAGQPGCASAGACPRGQKSYEQVAPGSSYTDTESKCDALHAEENAILYARRDLRGCTLYVNHQPCPNCTRLIAGTGISFVKWRGENGKEQVFFPEPGPKNSY